MRMNERKYRKLEAQMSEISKKTLTIATYTIDNKVKQELTEVERANSILLVCCCMIMGEKNTKRKYFGRGLAVGVIGAVVTGMVLSIRDKKETEKKES